MVNFSANGWVTSLQTGSRARQKYPELLAWAGLFILGGLLTALIFFASSRYRLVAAAHLAIFVGAGWDELREQWPRPLTRPVLAGALLFALSWLPARQAMRFQAASELYNLGGKHTSAAIIMTPFATTWRLVRSERKTLMCTTTSLRHTRWLATMRVPLAN